MAGRRRTGEPGGGRRLRLRLDRAGRHQGGGCRRKPGLADAPALPHAFAEPLPHADTGSDADLPTRTVTDTTPEAEAHADAETDA
ncbi:hypothetical protein [Streptomyces sp. NPDC046909]|uniref:hypothetical protein n=1 Tax=Streptomyces sp. NPDC046909 TaxID=3155617 RepID=UPI0033DF71AA